MYTYTVGGTGVKAPVTMTMRIRCHKLESWLQHNNSIWMTPVLMVTETG